MHSRSTRIATSPRKSLGSSAVHGDLHLENDRVASTQWPPTWEVGRTSGSSPGVCGRVVDLAVGGRMGRGYVLPTSDDSVTAFRDPEDRERGWETCSMPTEPVALMDRPAGPVSRVVGLYQTFLRRILEHFFPDAVLDIESDRSFIDWDGSLREEHFTLTDDPDGFGLRIEWFRTRYIFQHASPTPFLPAERRLIEIILQSLDLRFRGLFDPDVAHRL